ncbi:hypothetical protein OG909_10690 [Streptomyces sp. NBC_01754]|uniref:hypothetical protein n=1 Tax=Streptomyces sp. NBC_01754 TaxID=2975930 RepID=UPI002DDA5158|nr:hypothetical protein [Streptomyces sp. NBC_01754]WSC92722.1 hypothetical protein OG909_10690 [Streptomyces sp. NBC_01754]
MSYPLRAAALAALLLAGAVACGDTSGEGTSTSSPSSSSPAASDDAAGGSAAARIEAVNETMRTTTFGAIGTSTAYDGGLQQMTWNPQQGLRIEMIATPATRSGGDMYCHDGVTYISSDLFADTLKQQGQQITVPAELDDVYVTTKSEQGCDAYFALSPTGRFSPSDDAEVNGTPARAIKVSGSASATDTYYVSTKGPAYLLKMKSTRDGRTSSTTYVDFGKKKTVTLPRADKTMTMDAFRAKVGG